MPQHYQFEPGRIYIVFAKATPDDRIFRQLWKSHRLQEDQGVLLAANKDPHAGKPIKEVFWRELTELLKSGQAEDVKYALTHLDLLSGGGYDNPQDLDRTAVLKAVQPLIENRQPEIAREAIRVLGSGNPYLSPGSATFWLATLSLWKTLR